MICPKCSTDLIETSKYCHQCGQRILPPDYTNRRTKSRGNGQGTVYKRGSTYTAVYITGWRWDMSTADKPVKRRVSRSKGGFPTAAKARAYVPTLMNENEVHKVVTLNSLWLVYSQNAMTKLSHEKQTSYKIAYAKLADISLLDITTLDIERLQGTVSGNTTTYYPARDMKVLLSHLYKMAAAQETVRTNLAQYITLPTLIEHEQYPFNESEQSALWADYAAGNWWTGYILLMICTGMMPGELLKATKSMVDIENHLIIGAGLKTKKRKVVPLVLSQAIEPVIEHLMSIVDGDKLIRINKDNFYSRYYETLDRCGCRKLTPYSCRHTTATALTLQDIPLSIIQEIMRHSKLATTQRYIHIGVAPMLDAVNQISPQNKPKPE